MIPPARILQKIEFLSETCDATRAGREFRGIPIGASEN
jgi:hypothetical protein